MNITQTLTIIKKHKPFGLLEVFAYGLASSRSGLIIYQIIKKKQFRENVIPTTIEIVIVIAVLFVAATIEWNTIAAEI
jgi:hypothetical protein